MIKEILTPSGLKKRVPMSLEERQAEFDKALKECYAKREAEYPKVADYLDAQAKGDTEGMEAWNAKQLEVKARYPKPNRADYDLLAEIAATTTTLTPESGQ